MKQIFIGLFILLAIISCKKEKVDQPKIDEDIITKYISDKNLSAIATGTGLYYVINSVGQGVHPNTKSTVTVAYKGYLPDGNVFDESNNNGITFSLKSVIKGWQEGIPLFKEGGSGVLLIPSALGYGSKPTGSIPPNSVLVFDVHLIDVE